MMATTQEKIQFFRFEYDRVKSQCYGNDIPPSTRNYLQDCLDNLSRLLESEALEDDSWLDAGADAWLG